MIKSMTGFASLTHEDDRATLGVTVRAVNHRYLDLQLRLPPALANIESRIRAQLQKRVARGRVEIAISLQLRQPPLPRIDLNEDFTAALVSALEQARARGLVQGPLTPGDLLRLPQALRIQERAAEDDPGLEAQIASSVESALEQAFADLDGMRAREGEHLRNDLDMRKALLADVIERLVAAAETGRVELEGRLHERVRELVAEIPVDQVAVAQEIVRTAGRSDISEEVARFRAHLAHWEALSDSPEPCGRKLDFLLQEMNREINTIGSKADGLRVSELIITAKAELEKMREQVQNVE